MYNHLILSHFNENILRQLTAAAMLGNGVDADGTSGNIENGQSTMIKDEPHDDNCAQTTNEQEMHGNKMTNSVLHEINRQFLSALIQKGLSKSTTTESNKQNANLNPLTPPQTPITIATAAVASAKHTNASIGGSGGGGVNTGTLHATDTTTTTTKTSSTSHSMATNLLRYNKNAQAIDATVDSRHRKRKRSIANRSKKRRRNADDVSSADESDNDSDAVDEERFNRSDISSDLAHHDGNDDDDGDDGEGDENKSNCSDDGHESSNFSKIGIGFGDTETSIDSVSTHSAALTVGNSLFANNNSGQASASVNMNQSIDKDKLNLLKLISLQSEENKLVGE